MDIRAIVEEIGKDLNIPNLALTNDGTCSILIDEKLKVDIESDEAGDVVRLIGVMMRLSDVSSSDMFSSLLAANFSELANHNNFGIDPHELELVIFSQLDMKYVDTAEFYDRLESFVNDYEIWMGKIENSEVGSVSSSETPKDTRLGEEIAFMRI